MENEQQNTEQQVNTPQNQQQDNQQNTEQQQNNNNKQPQQNNRRQQQQDNDNQEDNKQNKRKSKNKELTKHKVDSTNLDWIAYDEDKKDLYIQFRSGGLYKYSDVPKDIFEGLLNSGSKGRYHNVKIKYKYKYEKLN